MKIRNIIIVVLFFFFIGKEIYSQDTNNYKIYIQPFEYKSGPSYFKYYTSSLPKSIRNTINKKIKTIIGDKTLNRRELFRSGYDFFMTGFLKITETEVFVTFSLIYVKTNTAVLIAFAHGSKEGQRIFDMIDGIVKLVVNVMGKPINKLLSTTVILSVEQSGEIRQRDRKSVV